MELDAIDKRILTALQRKGRMANSDLSEEINLSASACHRRVQRLEQDGYIKNYVALLDARKMGVPTTVFVEITLQAQADEVLDAFEKAVSRIPDVLECHLMAGQATLNLPGTKLTAPVRMQDAAGDVTSAGAGHLDRDHDEQGLHPLVDGPPDDPV